MPERLNARTQFTGLNGKPIVDGFIYIGVQGEDPKLNPITIYSDRALTKVLANPQNTDSNGRSVNKIWIPGRYSIAVEDENNQQQFQDLDSGETPGIAALSLTSVQGVNAITANSDPTIVGYVDKGQYIFTVVTQNTADEVTIAISGLAVIPIKRNLDQPVGKGKFKVSQLVVLRYNQTANVMEWTNENTKVFFDTQGSGIASGTTVNLASATGNQIDLTIGPNPIDSLGVVIAGVVFDLIYSAPSAVTITSSSIANPTNILCATAHGRTTGDIVIIEGHTGSTPDINGEHSITVVDSTNFTIDINVTTGGTGGTFKPAIVITHNSTSLQLFDNKTRTLRDGEGLSVKSLGSGNWKELQAIGAAMDYTGLVKPFSGLVAPSGSLLYKNESIGDVGSGATLLASKSANALFNMYWNSMADAQAPVSTGRGASAQADFDAGKTLTLPNAPGRMIVGTGGTAPAVHGDTGGAETHTLTLAETPDIANISHTAGNSSGGVTADNPLGSNTNFLNTIVENWEVSTGGGDGPHENMPPWLALNYIIKL